MPLIKRKPFVRTKQPDALKDDEEVFFCEQTKEIFKSYDEYFERVMLCNSVIWQCELTGRPNLTFSEALDSEKAARKLLRNYPRAIRAPVLLVASLTKRSALSELIDDVFNYIKDRFFKDEEVDVLNEKRRGYRFCKIVNVIIPTNNDRTIMIEPTQISYVVEAIDDDKDPQSWTVNGDFIRRDKTVFTRDRTKLFLKQHVEAINMMMKVKDVSLHKYAVEKNVKIEDLFVGKLPSFEPSKKLLLLQEKEKTKKGSKSSNNTSITTNSTKDVDADKSKKKKKDPKQNEITKYLNSDGVKDNKLTAEQKKSRDESSKKFRQDLERLKQEKADLEAEKQRKATEERARLLAKTQATVREYNQIRDDLELMDQRAMPKGTPVSTVMEQYFADFIKILEFLHSFPQALSISDKFPFGLTMQELERALILKEINGPLSDILQVLLGTIFSLQIEEANEQDIEYRMTGDYPIKHPKVEQMQSATKVHLMLQKTYRTNLNEMAMDSHTLSELLRLHLAASGSIVSDKTSKWRFAQRGGYQSIDDPGFHFVQNHSHILKTLTQLSVFQLSTKDIIRVVNCLIDQLLTYSSIREIIEDRIEASNKAKLEYKLMRAAEKRRELKVNDEKKALRDELKTKLVTFAESTPTKKETQMKNAETEVELKIQKIDVQSQREKEKYLKELKIVSMTFFNHQTYLGMDRGFRNYYMFECLPGLFVEHDLTNVGSCIDSFTKNNPALANSTREQRYAIIKQMVMSEEDSKNDDKENKAQVNGTAAQEKATMKQEQNGTVPSTVIAVKQDVIGDVQNDLFMCNCDANTCSVHADNPARTVWSYFHTPEEVDALIDCLNPRGYREKVLKEQLECEKELIVNYIKDCPLDKLSVNSDEVKRNLRKAGKKYENANFHFKIGMNPSVIYDTMLRENLLEFEDKLSVGCLGELKVSDRLLWRKTVEELGYQSLDDHLKWGTARKTALTNGKLYVDLETSNVKENGDDEDTDETASSIGDFDMQPNSSDSGHCSDMEMIDAKIDGTVDDAATFKLKVTNMAKALLQIEQGIDVKFIHSPFGPSKEIKDKELMTRALELCVDKLLRWEESLMKSTSYSQVFLHYNILYDSIKWSRSAKRVSCMVCRRKNDPESTLLCDECNKAWHMFCLKPKLDEIPTGDWFCPKCRPDDYKVKKERKRRKVFTVEEEVDDDSEEEKEVASGSQVDSDDSAAEDICHVCNFEGELSYCKTCDMQCHSECAKPPMKQIKKVWQCWKCLSTAKREERSKRRRADKGGVASESEDSEEELPPAKIRKIEKPAPQKRSKRIVVKSEEEESEKEDEEEEEAEEEDDDEEEEDVQEEDESDEEPVKKKKKHDNSRRSSRRKSSRKNTPEPEEPSRPTRRSLKKQSPERSDRRSKRSLDTFNNINLLALIDEIIKNKLSWPFNRPVSLSEVPDYHDVIKSPMDFSTIKSKLNLGGYKSTERMMKDIELVFYNCDLYNVAASEIYKAGVKLEKIVVKRCKELDLPFTPSEMVSN